MCGLGLIGRGVLGIAIGQHPLEDIFKKTSLVTLAAEDPRDHDVVLCSLRKLLCGLEGSSVDISHTPQMLSDVAREPCQCVLFLVWMIWQGRARGPRQLQP